MLRPFTLILPLTLLCACLPKSPQNDPSMITSMQMIDRNGFSETISSKDRLANYQKVDFKNPQPYQKVLRIFGRNQEGKSSSKITSYHSNGQLWQYLEVVDGRAHGTYQEWHSNGRIKIEAQVIEGVADISEMAQASWLFDGLSKVWNEDGQLIAKIQYSKGELHEPAFYYHPNGHLQKVIPYQKNKIDGEVQIFDLQGNLIEEMIYDKGVRQGTSRGFWTPAQLQYEESYQKDLLMEGVYYDQTGKQISSVVEGNGFQANFDEEVLYSLVEHQNGVQEGLVKIFDSEGFLQGSYSIREGKKNGEEWEYYSKSTQPKLCIYWQDDAIQGIAKTWYENGTMESQREMNNNKKHGHAFAWYKDGQLMFMEEYDTDVLMEGKYYKKGDKNPIAKIEHGTGLASLYDGNGHFVRKISYERGRPIVDVN